MPLGIANILTHLSAQSTTTKHTKALTQLRKICTPIPVTCPKSLRTTKDLIVDNRRKAIEFHKGVLQWRCSKKDLLSVLNRPANCLSHFVLRSIRVAQFVRFVYYDHIPILNTYLAAHRVGKIEGHDNDSWLFKSFLWCTPCLPQRFCIQNDSGQVEFFLQFQSPLLANRSRAYHEDPALALGPILTDDKSRFDSLAKSHLVGEDHALGEWRAQCKKRCLDLVRIEVDLCIEKRHR